MTDLLISGPYRLVQGLTGLLEGMILLPLGTGGLRLVVQGLGRLLEGMTGLPSGTGWTLLLFGFSGF